MFKPKDTSSVKQNTPKRKCECDVELLNKGQRQASTAVTCSTSFRRSNHLREKPKTIDRLIKVPSKSVQHIIDSIDLNNLNVK